MLCAAETTRLSSQLSSPVNHPDAIARARFHGKDLIWPDPEEV
jgi:hypothetical protein